MITRNGLMIDPSFRSSERRDILICNGKIKEISSTGMSMPDGSEKIEADGYILMPRLINAHTNCHGSLAN